MTPPSERWRYNGNSGYAARLHARPSVPVLGLVCVGVFAATLTAQTPGAQLAIPVLSIVLLSVTLMGLGMISDADTRQDLTALVLVALVVRLGVFVVVSRFA